MYSVAIMKQNHEAETQKLASAGYLDLIQTQLSIFLRDVIQFGTLDHFENCIHFNFIRHE